MKSKKIAELSLLTAVALTIFIVELQIPNPVPIPGVKPGLSNIVTVYAIYSYRPHEAAMVLFARILLGTLVGGNFFAMLFSLSGGALCLAGMLALRRVIDVRHIWISSVLGAVLHNVGQIAVAAVVTGTLAVAAYLPVLLVSGCAAGLFTGLCAGELIKRLPRK